MGQQWASSKGICECVPTSLKSHLMHDTYLFMLPAIYKIKKHSGIKAYEIDPCFRCPSFSHHFSSLYTYSSTIKPKLNGTLGSEEEGKHTSQQCAPFSSWVNGNVGSFPANSVHITKAGCGRFQSSWKSWFGNYLGTGSVFLYFRAPQLKPQGPHDRQCGPREEEGELICTRRPKVFTSLDVVVATLGIYPNEEIFRNADKALCVKILIAVVIF